jgi:hypothetical protein
MAWTWNFTDVDWQVGHYLEEQKLDQMIENDKYVREQVGTVPLINFMWNRNHNYDQGYGYTTEDIEVWIEGTQIVDRLDHSTNPWSKVNIDVSATGLNLTKGLSEVRLWGDAPGTSVDFDQYGYCVITNEIEYISVFSKVSAIGAAWYSSQCVTLIGHRESQAW